MVAAAQINTLIDKEDNFEIIRDEIAAILVVELANQQVLAAAAGKDPDNWKMDVYTERSNPWEQFLNDLNTTPIVNVWFDSNIYDPSSSNSQSRQKTDGTFNIDCYGRGVASDSGAGHIAGDESAARAAQKALVLCRNILMSSFYIQLGMQGVVWRKWPQNMTVFQMQETEQTALQVVGSRLTMMVEFNEYSPQYVPETLELLSATVTRASDGRIYFEAQYP